MSQERYNKTTRIVTATSVALLILAGIYMTAQKGHQSRLENHLNEERLKSESLLAEKLSLEKEIYNLKADIIDLRVKNDGTDGRLKSALSDLEAVELELQKSKKQHTSIAQLKKQQQELIKVRDNLQRQIADSEKLIIQIQDRNSELEQENALQAEQNRILVSEMAMLNRTSIDNISVQVRKSNNKLTVKARRAKKLVVEVDVAINAVDIDFKVINSHGREIEMSDDEKKVSPVDSKKQSILNASLLNNRPVKRVQLIYIPHKRLASGSYTILVRTDSITIGTVQATII